MVTLKRQLPILKASEKKQKRLELFNKQRCICPVCGLKTPFSESVLDHQHRLLKSDRIGENGIGQIRGVLCFQCNSWEGKIFNSFRRYGLHKKGVSITTLLRNLADYLDQEPLPLIHPSEIKTKKVSKRNYKLLKKRYKGLKKFPEYPKSERLTKGLKVLFDEHDINPYNEKT